MSRRSAAPQRDELLSYPEWRALARRQRAPAACCVYAGFGVEVRAVEAEGESQARRLRFVISTGDVDRYNDTVNPEGWEWANWLATGAPVFWSHRSWEMPIANGVDIAVENGALVSTADFGAPGEDEFADRVYRAALQARVKGASVGFLPLEWSYDEPRGGFNIMRAELIEWSITPVPANPAAVRLAYGAGAPSRRSRRSGARSPEPAPLPATTPSPVEVRAVAVTPEVVRAATASAVQQMVASVMAKATGRLED